MIVDVTHGLGRDTGFADGHPDCAGRLFAAFLQAYPMVGFACGSVAGDLPIDARAAGPCVLQLFEHQEPGAFGQHEAVPVARKRTGCSFGLGIPACRHDAHQHEPAQNQGRNRRIHASRHHDIENAGLYVSKRITDCVCR